MDTKKITLKQLKNKIDNIQDTYENYIYYLASKYIDDTCNYLYNNDNDDNIIIDINKILESSLFDVSQDIRSVSSVVSDYNLYMEDIEDILNISDAYLIDDNDNDNDNDNDIKYDRFYASLNTAIDAILNSL